MRTLATIALSFAAGVFAAVLLGVGVWQLWAAGACLLVGLVLLGLKRTMPARLRLRGMLILFALCGALVYTALFQALVQAPVTARCGQMGEFSGTVLSRPVETEWGVRVTIRLSGSAAKAEVYADAEYAGLEPGQRLSGTAQWQDAARIRENDVTAFTSRGVFALLYARGPLTAEEGSAGSIRWLPQRAVYALREKIAAIWPDGDTAAFVTAELTGDRSGMTEEDAAVIRRINETKPDFVWVGLGAPKQERWMAAHEDKVQAVMVGVGAAFDYEAGNIRRAPMWMQRHNLEWLYRLMQDPKRLFKRYLTTNIKYLWWTWKQ